MSWPSIWQTQNQAPSAQAPAVNAGMFQMTAEQQYALQQQNWQQWQMYQTQLAQWQAQYGERYQQIQNEMSNVYGSQVLPPPLPMDHQPPPPPPPQQITPEKSLAAQTSQQNPSIEQASKEQYSDNPNDGNSSMNSHQTTFNKNSNFDKYDNSNYSQQPDGFRRNNRNSRWNNNRNSRGFGDNNFNNRNNFDRDEPAFDNAPEQNPYENEEKSQEEIAFDNHFRKWEDQFIEWKRNNSNHPDQGQYNDFVIKMEGCRKQLLQKRDSLRQKRLDSIRDAQKIQSNQNPDSGGASKSFEKNTNRENVSNNETNQIENETPAASLFPTNRSDSESGIPGLDLVSGEAAPKTDLVAHVNNILGNPEIQSLLSNIQKKQNDAEQKPTQQNTTENNSNDNDRNTNTFNRFGNAERFEANQNIDIPQRNPFRNNYADNSDLPQFPSDQFENRAKRGRFWNENSSNEPAQQNDQFNRDRGNFSQQQQQPSNQDAARFQDTRKRPRDSDVFNNDRNNFNMSQNECDEFRPMQVIDYQNRTQNHSNQSSFSHQPQFSNQNQFPNQSPFQPNQSNFPNRMPFVENFVRKVINYDHKSKTHSWNWFCPIVQLEYNHGKKGLSLHVHPPPKPVVKAQVDTTPKWPKQEPRDEFRQLRQPKWQHGPNERQERFPYAAPGPTQYSRYDNRQKNAPPGSQQPEPYFRRNAPERNWTRNYREHIGPQGGYGYDRPELRNPPQRGQSDDILPNTSSSYQRHDTHLQPESNTKQDLKELLFLPGRRIRPKKIVILMRGAPGSGKSYVSKLIKDKEQEMGGSARILSIDDYFMTETDNLSRQLSYQYDADEEENYMQYLLRSFKKTLTDNLYSCVIIDCNNNTLQHLTEFNAIAKLHMYTPYICELPLDLEKCLKNNIHGRAESDIKKVIDDWIPTPFSYTVLDYECLFNNADATEEISDLEDDKDEKESLDAVSDEDCANAERDLSDDLSDEPINEFGVFKSKWDNDTTGNKLARLDGTNKPIKHTTIEDYLQMDGWQPPPTSTNGKKRVRWADIEEKREQDKQRAIGFVVGQTDWNNLINQPRDHSHALNRVKYIEKVRKN